MGFYEMGLESPSTFSSERRKGSSTATDVYNKCLKIFVTRSMESSKVTWVNVNESQFDSPLNDIRK